MEPSLKIFVRITLQFPWPANKLKKVQLELSWKISLQLIYLLPQLVECSSTCRLEVKPHGILIKIP